jgi:hypothetical protein
MMMKFKNYQKGQAQFERICMSRHMRLPTAVFFDGRADKGDHADPDESLGEKGA